MRVLEQPSCGPLDLGAWIDDPPRLVLESAYLDALRALPLSHLAVMVDGPRPGLSDARWTPRQLAQLRRAMPDHELVLTTWWAAQRRAIDELAVRLPELLDALETRTVEGDTEPVGEWAPRAVEGYRDEGGDPGALDEAADALAEVLVGLELDAIEVTTFPGALRHVRSLIRALSRYMAPDQALRLVLQLYAVRSRGSSTAPTLVEWDGALGPERLPREAITRARRDHPGVEICAGLAAYDQRWPGHAPAEAMHVALTSAAGTGVRRVRWWSTKHLVRLAARSYSAPAIELLRPISRRG